MKKNLAIVLALVLVLGLAACSGSVFGVDTQGDNSIQVVAEIAAKNSGGTGTLTVGENEKVVIDMNCGENDKLQVRMAQGAFALGELPEDAVVATVSGKDSASFTIDPGEYTVEVTVLSSRLTGTAKIYTRPSEAKNTAAADDDFYSAVTALPKAEVEAFALAAKEAYLSGDWETLSGMIRYPITMYPDVVVNSAEEFLSYMEGKTADESDVAALKEETGRDMFFNGQGICLGSGQLWLNDANYMTDNAPELKIIAVSGIVPAGQ